MSDNVKDVLQEATLKSATEKKAITLPWSAELQQELDAICDTSRTVDARFYSGRLLTGRTWIVTLERKP